MATQPTNDLLIWANTDVNLPNLAGPNKTEPSADLVAKGWDFKQKPSADEFNYILNNLGKWVEYLKTLTAEGTPLNTPSTLVERDASGNFAASRITSNLTGDVTGNADTASKWQAARTLTATGFATGTVAGVDGSGNINLALSMGSGFTNSKTTNGYTYLPNGLIFQWGYVATAAAGGTSSITFPVTFPTACLQVIPSLVGVAESTITYVKTSSSTVGGAVFMVDADNGTGVSWLAVGY